MFPNVYLKQQLICSGQKNVEIREGSAMSLHLPLELPPRRATAQSQEAGMDCAASHLMVNGPNGNRGHLPVRKIVVADSFPVNVNAQTLPL